MDGSTGSLVPKWVQGPIVCNDAHRGPYPLSTSRKAPPRLTSTRPATVYEGVVEMASPGLHDAAFRVFVRHARKGGSVADFGSGLGAWALRLQRNGYDVRAFDLVESESAPVRIDHVDLNGPFADVGGPDGVDAVTLIEVIEHLENPRHVLREICAMLRPEGILLLTTPNASGVYSRVRFFFTGEHAMFNDAEYERSGHITPMTTWTLDTALG